jgi:hypothetical protein
MQAFDLCPALKQEVYYWQKSEYDWLVDEDDDFWDSNDEKQNWLARFDLVHLERIDKGRNGITIACKGFDKDPVKVGRDMLIASITKFLLALESERWCFVTEIDMNWLFSEELFRGKRNGIIKDIKSLGVDAQTKEAILVSREELLKMIRFTYGHVTGTSSTPDIHFSAIGSTIAYYISKHGLIWLLCFDDKSIAKVEALMPKFGCYRTDIDGNPLD